MSWHFSRELVEASLVDISSGGEPSALSSSIPMPEMFFCPGRTTEAFRRSRSGMTCEPLTGALGEAVLTWCLEASPVKTSAQPARGPGLTGSAQGYGARWRGLLARWDPGLRSWKTVQCSLLEGLDVFSETWPRWGMMRGGACSELLRPAHLMSETGSGLWPTPCRIDQDFAMMTVKSASGEGHQKHVTTELIRVHGQRFPLPSFGEALMGFPLGWVRAGVALGTGKFQQWRRLHGKCFALK